MSSAIENAPSTFHETLKIQTMIMKRSKKTCAICMEGFEEEQIIKKLYCSHIFHRKCLKEWMKRNKVCPLCRSDLAN